MLWGNAHVCNRIPWQTSLMSLWLSRYVLILECCLYEDSFLRTLLTNIKSRDCMLYGIHHLIWYLFYVHDNEESSQISIAVCMSSYHYFWGRKLFRGKSMDVRVLKLHHQKISGRLLSIPNFCDFLKYKIISVLVNVCIDTLFYWKDHQGKRSTCHFYNYYMVC